MTSALWEAGLVGMYNDAGTGVLVDDFMVYLDSDGDSLNDIDERGGIMQDTGIATFAPSAGSASYDFVLYEGGNFNPFIRAKYPKDSTFEISTEIVGGGGLSYQVFRGTGSWAIYKLNGQLSFASPAKVSISLAVVLNSYALELDWIGLRYPGPADQSTHIEDGTDLTNSPSGVTTVRKVLRYMDEWEYADLDQDKAYDFKETRIQFRTNVPFGSNDGFGWTNAGSSSWVDYYGWHYAFGVAQLSTTQGNEHNLGALFLTLEDGTSMYVDSHTAPASSDPDQTQWERIYVWPFGARCSACYYLRYDRNPAQSALSDSPTQEFGGAQEIALTYQSETSNLKFAYLIGVYDDTLVSSQDLDTCQGDTGPKFDCHPIGINIEGYRNALAEAGYVDDSIEASQSCSGTSFDSSWNAVQDRILVADGDLRDIDDFFHTADGQYDFIHPCVNDLPATKSVVKVGFQALGSVMDNNDQLVVMVIRSSQMTWYRDCDLEISGEHSEEDEWFGPGYEFGIAGSPSDGPVIEWMRPADISCTDAQVQNDFTYVKDFLDPNGDYIGKITRYQAIVVYGQTAGGRGWYGVAPHMPRTAIITTDSRIQGTPPSNLDNHARGSQSCPNGAVLPGEMFIDYGGKSGSGGLPDDIESEATAYLLTTFTQRTFGANDLAGSSYNDRYANSWKTNGLGGVKKAWIDRDESEFASFLEGFNYAVDHDSPYSCSATWEWPDTLAIDDDGQRGMGQSSSSDWMSTGHVDLLNRWQDGRNLSVWIP